MPAKELRRLFDVASTLAAEDREREDSDKVLVQWISKQVERRGLIATAKMLQYDAANLAKVLVGKRTLPGRLRRRASELLSSNIVSKT
jgi:hypothetical protein